MKSKLLILFGIGCFVLLGLLVWQMFRPQNLSFDHAPKYLTDSIDAVPAEIRIDSITVNLPIVPAQIHGDDWETTSRGVSFLDSSTVPGNLGNSIMYGHNWPNLLGRLPQVKPGDLINITMSDGQVRNFVVSSIEVVDPSKNTVLDNTSDARLTIYTCTGFLDSKRFVVVAIPM